jgi:antitoxin ParD1/3/4
MTTLNVSLPDEVRAFIEERVAREGHSSAGDYLAALVREAQRRLAKQELEAKLREAVESGPATPMTREDWDSIEREALARLAAERSPR